MERVIINNKTEELVTISSTLKVVYMYIYLFILDWSEDSIYTGISPVSNGELICQDAMPLLFAIDSEVL